MSDDVARSGIAELPTSSDFVVGGHAVLAVGYDESERRFTLRNSWGESWGDRGYFTLPYEYLESEDLCDDFWTLRRMT